MAHSAVHVRAVAPPRKKQDLPPLGLRWTTCYIDFLRKTLDTIRRFQLKRASRGKI